MPRQQTQYAGLERETPNPATAQQPQYQHGDQEHPPMSHRQILETLTGLLTGMFVAILSSTIVANALPTIIASLHAGQTAYSWVITATLLAMTVTTPIWGKLSDLVDKKLLVQLSLVIFVTGSMIAGLSSGASQLIAARVIQGVGAGGMMALTQTILAVMIPPRQRGRYAGYMGGVFALGTVIGPLVGGAIVDTPGLGWRWCFFIGVPFAAVAIIVLQFTMHLTTPRRQVSIDWLGAVLVAAATSLLLIWVSFAGSKYPWLSAQTVVMVVGALVLVGLFFINESYAEDPIIPLRLFRNRTIALSTFASLAVGVAMFAGTAFLSQYFQLAKGKSPTVAGLLTLPLIVGMALVSLISGRVITRTGRWKPVLVLGSFTILAGIGLWGTARYDTPYGLLALYMFLIGAGVGMTQQNMILAVQNQVRPEEVGATSATVAFMRSLGGAVGVSALGAVLGMRISRYTDQGLARLHIPHPATSAARRIPKLSELPPPIRSVIENAYGHGIGDIFLYSTPVALLVVLAVVFIKEVPLRTTVAVNDPAQTPDSLPRQRQPVTVD